MATVDIRIRIGQGTDSSERTYRIEADPGMTVLDALELLRARHGLAVPQYRHSCHHGSCGTCGALVDGRPVLMCLTPVVAAGPEDATVHQLLLEPLPGFEVIAGIAVNPSRLFSAFPDGLDYLRPAEPRPAPANTVPDWSLSQGETPTALERTRMESCIECGLCVSACPVAVPFRGPAALAAINRQREKQPDSLPRFRRLLAATDGVVACQRHIACSKVCPQAVYPAKHIQLLRLALDRAD